MLGLLFSDASAHAVARLAWLALGFALLHHERWRRPAAVAVWEMRKANVQALDGRDGGEPPT